MIGALLGQFFGDDVKDLYVVLIDDFLKHWDFVIVLAEFTDVDEGFVPFSEVLWRITECGDPLLVKALATALIHFLL